MAQLSAHPGAGYFPLGLAIILAILGAIVLFKSLTDRERRRRTGRHDRLAPAASSSSSAIALFGAMLEPLGLFITMPVLIIIVSFAGDEFGGAAC